MRSLLLVPILAAAAFFLEGCGQSCTLVGCQDGMRLAVAARCWPDGSYVVSGTLDGVPFSIPVDLPLRPDEARFDGGVEVDASDAAGIAGLFVRGRPKVVELSIRRGDLAIVDATLTPDYRRYYPNGEDCEPVCYAASSDLAVDEPVAKTLCGLLEER